ncbi:MAG: trypsin-like peptidase domain-containing protein [Thermoguttaceae bacterium]|nr:trypsin-like peptidase domain-containing protein [Thermoguttaceae bacterium]
MLRRQTKRRTWARVGGVLLSAAALTGAAATTPISTEANDGNARSPAALAPTTNGANPFAARLVVLEFASKTDADAARTNALLNAMRNKNYPIQRVERENGGAELFDRFAVVATPTFVLLVDGKEVDRVATPGTPSPALLRNQLLRLFARGREELAVRTAKKNSEAARVTRAQTTDDSTGFAVSGAPVAPEAPTPLAAPVANVPAAPVAPITVSAPSAPSAPNPISLAAATLPASAPAPIAQVSANAPSAASTANPGPNNSSAAERAILDAAVWERLDEATVRIDLVVGTGADGRSDSATGVVAHSDPRHGEALVATCGHLFREVSDWSAAKISVVASDPKSGRVETVVGECVYSDPETDVAFVAFRAPWTIRPVAFLPENETLRVGESALSVARNERGALPLEHKILSLDRHYFEPKADDATRKPFNYVQVSNAPEAGRSGGGLFVERAGKYYWAGLCVAGDPKEGDGFFVPASIAASALLSNENLAVALADQRAGKFEAPTLAVVRSNANLSATTPLPESPTTAVAAEPLETFASFAADAPSKNVRAGRAATTQDAQSVPVASLAASKPSAAVAGKTGEGVRSTSFEAPGVAAVSAPVDAELLDAALDALRRRALEGAEIVCIVNWGAADGNDRETEVVRLPRQNAGSQAPLGTPNVATDSFVVPQAPTAPSAVEVRASSTFPDASLLR